MAFSTPAFARPNSGSPEDMRLWADQLVGQLEAFLATVMAPHGQPYTVTNPVDNRSLNVSTATLSQVTQVVGTLIADLQASDQIARS